MKRDVREVVINGKFLLAPLEGMPRVGRELTAAMDVLIGEGGYPELGVHLLTPKGGASQIALRHIRIEEVGRTAGLLWEQAELPLRLKGRYSLHFTSTAPVAVRRGCVIVHDAQFRSTPASHSAKSGLLFGAVTPIVARRYHTVTTVSHHAKDELCRYGVTCRPDVRVIANGADHVLRRVPDRSILDRFGLVPGGYILSNSHRQAHKNVRVVLDALRGDPALATRLVLYGGTTADAYRQQGIAVPDGALFTGRVSDEELVALIGGAAMFLFPSTTEGFGLPPLEAMLLGCPTICARAGAMPEVCGDGAWYAAPHDPAAWLTLVRRLWDDPAARAELAQAGRTQAERYTWRNAAAAYLDLIREEIVR